MTENQPEWGAKLALACYVALLGGLLISSLIIGFILSSMKTDYENLSFPYTLLSTPIVQTMFLGITLLFASPKKLGFKKISPQTAVTVSILAVLLIPLAAGILITETTIFGPDPTEEQLGKLTQPTTLIQLIAFIILNLAMVGPVEELAFRGFVQKGFENSLGKIKGLLTAAGLFGLLHGLNSPYSILPLFAGGLVLGYVWQRTAETQPPQRCCTGCTTPL